MLLKKWDAAYREQNDYMSNGRLLIRSGLYEYAINEELAVDTVFAIPNPNP